MMIRISGLAAVCLAVPAVAFGTQISTTIRAESPSGTVIPTTRVTVDPAAPDVTVTDTTDSDVATVPAGSAFAQLAGATSLSGMVFGFDATAFGPFVARIGAAGSTSTAFWRYKVNGVLAPVGAHDFALSAGDRVTWSLVTDFDAPELDISVSGDAVQVGETVTATVRRVDNMGVATPASGVRVRYGSTSVTADDSGTAVFVATTSGIRTVQASESPASGPVRSEALEVCAYGLDPTVCGLPSRPGAEDTVAPGSQITGPRPGRLARIVRLRGVVSPDRSDIAGVQVAIARRVGTRCRFLAANGRYGRARACSQRRWVRARVSGVNWLYRFKRPVAPGRYIAWSRAIDGVGNRERVTLRGINIVAFTVTRPEVGS